jgi:GTPase
MTYPEFPDQETPSTGELALDDRAALRRVAGLSTELADVSEVEYRQLRLERVVLVGVWTDGSAADADASLAASRMRRPTSVRARRRSCVRWCWRPVRTP